MPRRRFVVNPEPVVAVALATIRQQAAEIDAQWALIGGHGLQAHGVPRDTLDLDIMVAPEKLRDLALALTAVSGWQALTFDPEISEYVDAAEVTVLWMQDDPVLMDIGEDRQMVALMYDERLPVELLAAQHPVERCMLDESLTERHHGVPVPLAPLGGILLVKAKAHRPKDIKGLEQSAEHMTKAQVDRAVSWARRMDPATADDLESILTLARTRRAPGRYETVKRHR